MAKVEPTSQSEPLALPGLLPACKDAMEAAEGFLGQARQAMAALIAPSGNIVR